jgi:hypothetical protein
MRNCLVSLFILLFTSACHFAGKYVGLHDDFSSVRDWYEILPPNDTVSPTVKLELKNGVMIIHHRHRSLEEAYRTGSYHP